MPIKQVRYSCQFKCRAQIQPLAKMITHESFCRNNPENKSCETCSNRIYDREKVCNDHGVVVDIWVRRGCKMDVMNDFIESVHDQLLTLEGRAVKPLFHCPNHNQTEPQPLTTEYIHNVGELISKAYQNKRGQYTGPF